MSIGRRLLLHLLVLNLSICEGWIHNLQEFRPRATTAQSKMTSFRSQDHNMESTQRRRLFQSSAALLVVASTGMMIPSLSIAAAPLDAGEAIRRSAANIPGFGPTDVFFPLSVKGNWKATRQVELSGRTLTLTYPFRFIQSIDDNAVVVDRGTNQAALEKALVETVSTKDGTVRSYEWTMSNPNDLRLVLADGSKKEIKVTKRATENTESTISSSEFQRITLEESNDKGFGVPSISARRVLTKWKIIDDATIEALEVVYNIPTGGDPLAGGASTTQPSILSKSRILLTR